MRSYVDALLLLGLCSSVGGALGLFRSDDALCDLRGNFVTSKARQSAELFARLVERFMNRIETALCLEP